MNTENTQLPESGNEFESAMQSTDKAKASKGRSDKASAIGKGLGAAAAGAAMGVGSAEAIAQITEDDITPGDIQIEEIDGPATQPQSQPQSQPQTQPQSAAEEIPPVVEESTDEPEQPVAPEEPEVEEPIDIVTPEDDIVNPDDVVEEILAVEEIDMEDSPGSQMFAFNGTTTIYTVDGEELSAASFISDNGIEGLMVDIDGDGVYDEIAVATDEGYVGVAEAPGFTVDDVELQISEENSYLAHDSETDHTLEDDSFMDDLIDPTTLA